METGKCKHCGADESLHRGDTFECPDNGQESGDVGHNYWLNTTFEATDVLKQEAENVFQETGLTPRQLLEHRDEMKSLIDKIMTNLTIALDHPHAAEACEEVAASLTDDIEEYIQKTKTK